MQNVPGKLSRTPGQIHHTGPRMGEHNREILIDKLGYKESDLSALGIDFSNSKKSIT
jgi:crotonobetainyl-CoA:carnitine CoA-transferase CaiB-like acyl-CoA transferase